MQKKSPNYYHVLVVDSEQESLTKIEFDLLEHNYHSMSADSIEKAQTILEKHDVHAVIVNNSISETAQLALLKSIRTHHYYHVLPVVFLAETSADRHIVSSLKHGVNDVVILPYIPALFIVRLNHVIVFNQLKQEIMLNSKKDMLTGLDNRLSFTEFTRRAIAQNNRDPNSFLTIISFDLDAYKTVNEQHGYDIGDEILKQVANIILSSFREYDLVARISGEQFAICMVCTDPEAAFIASDRCRDKIAKTDFGALNKLANSINITVSAGIASNIDYVCTFEQLMVMADKALHLAKDKGQNQVVCYKTIDKKTTEAIDEIAQEQDMLVKYPGIDIAVGLNNVLDDSDLFDEILIMFYQDHHQDGDNLRKAISSGDIITAKHLAHTLKGVASSIGAMDLFKYAEVLDKLINENKPQEVLLPQFEPVASELKKVTGGIYKELSHRL